MSATIKAKLERLSTPDVADILRKLGITKVVMQRIRPLVRVTGTVAGPSRTLRLLPDREDLKTPPNGPVNRNLYDSIEPGEVLVLDAMREEGKAALGDMIFGRLDNRGAAAVIVDGAVRDIPVLADRKMPVFALGSAPTSFAGWLRPFEADVPIQCGGVLVRPRDWLVADAEGVVVIPQTLVGEVADLGVAQRELDAFSTALLNAGFGLDDAYPLPHRMKCFLAAFQSERRLPTVEEVAATRTG